MLQRNVFWGLVIFLQACCIIAQADVVIPQTDTVGSTNQQVQKWSPIHTGGLSVLIPGAGQVYTGHYIMGGAFIATEVITASVAHYWYGSYKERLDKADALLRAVPFAKTKRDSVLFGEEAMVFRFDARSAKYTMYDALSWMVGGYVYNICDALYCSRHFDSDIERNPRKAGLLAAVPGLGLGQIYNGEISKAGRIMMGQVSLGLIAINEHRLMKKAEREYNRVAMISDSGVTAIVNEYKEVWESRQQNAFKNRNTYLWYSIFYYLYGIIDAVVDAHLHDYNRKMRAYPDLIAGEGVIGFNVEYQF